MNAEIRDGMIADIDRTAALLKEGLVKTSRLQAEAYEARIDDLNARRDAVSEISERHELAVAKLCDEFKTALTDTMRAWRKEIDLADADEIRTLEAKAHEIGLPPELEPPNPADLILETVSPEALAHAIGAEPAPYVSGVLDRSNSAAA